MLHSHHEHIPEFGKNSIHPDDKHVLPGETLVITGTKIYRHIYVDGEGTSKAIISLTEGCKLKVQTILLNGLNALLQSDSDINCEVIWRDLPLNTTNVNDYFDPQQFGNGLINLSGEIFLRGKNPRSAKAQLSKEISAGDTILFVVQSPATLNWKVGDKLCLPDTRQPTQSTFSTSQTEFVTISAINGNAITITSPTVYSHLALDWEDKSVRELPEIGNCTQGIVFKSENPNGTRGHMIHMDHCLLDMRGYVLQDMGRTTTAPLHSTIWDAHVGPSSIKQIGTNQIGRYSDHDHGMPGRATSNPYQSYRRNFCIIGSPKLGLVKHHSSHFGLCEQFVIVDCAGCDITHETPNVYGNVYINGFLCGKTIGSKERVTDRAHRNLAGGDHWHGGVGLGLQSAMSEFHKISIYNRKEGIVLVGFATSLLQIPTVKGVHTDVKNVNNKPVTYIHKDEKEYPFLPTSEIKVWGCWRGIETWTANCWEDTPRMFPGLKIIHTRIPTDFEDQRETYLYNWKILGDFTQIQPVINSGSGNTFGVNFKDGYRFGIQVVGGEISGYDCAYNFVLDDEYTLFTNVHINCPLVAYHPLGRYDKSEQPIHIKRTEWKNCTWGTSVKRLMDGWFTKYNLSTWMKVGNTARESLEPITYEVKPWKDGKDYKLYHYEQHPNFSLPPIASDQFYGDWPLGVNTNQELIARGTPIFGEAIPPNAIQREDFGTFYALDITPTAPPTPLTLEQRVERLELEVFGEIYND